MSNASNKRALERARQIEELDFWRSFWWFIPGIVTAVAWYKIMYLGKKQCIQTVAQDIYADSACGWVGFPYFYLLAPAAVIGVISAVIGVVVLTVKFIKYRRILQR